MEGRLLGQKLAKLPQQPGVYVFGNNQEGVVYVGKAVNLRLRVRSYFSSRSDEQLKVGRIAKKTVWIGWIEVISELEALLLEAKLIKRYLPRYNSVAKDDKHPLYIVIGGEEFPKVRVARKGEEGEGEFFGPFPSGVTVRRVMKVLRKVVPFCTCKSDRGRPCLYALIGQCRPSPRAVVRLPEGERREGKAKYLRNVRLLRRILSGEFGVVIGELEKEMRQLSRWSRFEEAAYVRDTIGKLRWVLRPRVAVQQFLDNPRLAGEQRRRAVRELARKLRLEGLVPEPGEFLERIEAYDISSLMGEWATGAMVVFREGQPDLAEYRRFKMKGLTDDVGAMREMVSRRLGNESWKMPDLIIVDGGKAQLRGVREVLAEKGVLIPVVGLAKREEVLWLSTGKEMKSLRLSLGSPSLQLVQHLRDEAHRFAKRYHVALRRKARRFRF